MKKILVLLFLFVSLVSSSAQGNRFECDGTCSPDETGQATVFILTNLREITNEKDFSSFVLVCFTCIK